jgi:hypothetical protein
VNPFRYWRHVMARALSDAMRDNPRLLDELPISDDERAKLRTWVGEFSSRRRFVTGWLRNAPSALVRLLPLVLIIVAYVGGGLWAPKVAGPDYFVAAAGVIPVLLLALALETRILRFGWLVDFRPTPAFPARVYDTLARIDDTTVRRLIPVLRKMDTMFAWCSELTRGMNLVILAVAVLCLLSVSEWQCMHVLASVSDLHRQDPSLVSAGILAGLVGVSVVAILGGSEDS